LSTFIDCGNFELKIKADFFNSKKNTLTLSQLILNKDFPVDASLLWQQDIDLGLKKVDSIAALEEV